MNVHLLQNTKMFLQFYVITTICLQWKECPKKNKSLGYVLKQRGKGFYLICQFQVDLHEILYEILTNIHLERQQHRNEKLNTLKAC